MARPSEYEPAGQSAQVDADAAKRPAWHDVQNIALALETAPVAQDAHATELVAPNNEEYVPMGHAMHDEAPAVG